MITRIVMLMLITVLALPVTSLTRHGDTSQAPWSQSAVAAKGKKHKKDKPKTRTVTRIVRGTVTESFISTAPIAFTVAAPNEIQIPASPYPAAIEVSGFTNGVITDVNLILTDLTNGFVSDVGVLVSHDDGRRALVMSDVGDGIIVTDVDLTLDDEAAAPLSKTAVSSGTFQPTDFNAGGPETFPAPAPQPNGSVALSTFDGTDPNGTWQLWVKDSAGGDPGDIGGWALEITAEVDTGTVDEQVPVAKNKKHKKRGKGRR
jgi:hypothetical protein